MNITLSNVTASIPDTRDFPYVTRQGPFPVRTDLLPHVFEIDNQGSEGSCTGFATHSVCEFLKPQKYGPRFLYWVTRNLIENRAGQQGASLRDALRAAFNYGIPLSQYCEYDVQLIDVRPSDDAFSNALIYRITRYERIAVPDEFAIRTSDWSRSFEQAIKSSLSEGLPVLFASRVGEQIKHLTGPWQLHKMSPVDMPYRNNPQIGAHAIYIVGNDDSIYQPCPGMNQNGSWLIPNSWGKTYGDGGFFGYPYAALANDVMEAWVVRGFADVMINPEPEIPYITQPDEVLRRFHELWRMDVTDPYAPSIQHYAYEPKFPTQFWDDYERIVTAKLAEVRAAYAKEHP